jgi:Inositol-pentakisphosphate 2-kinase
MQFHQDEKNGDIGDSAAAFEWKLCPLYFTSEEYIGTVSQHLCSSLSPLMSYGEERLSAALIAASRWFQTLEARILFDRLKTLQQKYDPKGPMHAMPYSEDLSLAMTLRDCTIFLRATPPSQPAETDRIPDAEWKVTTKLADFDRKQVATKWKYWKDTEASLQEWYCRRRQPGEIGPDHIGCFLERPHPTAFPEDIPDTLGGNLDDGDD